MVSFYSNSYFTITELFLTLDWSRAMVDKSTESGTDVMVAQFVFLFLRARFPEKLQPKWTSKTVNAIVKTNRQ